MECTTQRVLVCFIAFLVLVLLAAVISYCWRSGPPLSKPAIYCGSAAAVLGGGLAAAAAWRGGRRANVRRGGAKPAKVGGAPVSAKNWEAVDVNRDAKIAKYVGDMQTYTETLKSNNEAELQRANIYLANSSSKYNSETTNLTSALDFYLKANTLEFILTAVNGVNTIDPTKPPPHVDLEKALSALSALGADRHEFVVDLIKAQGSTSRAVAVQNLNELENNLVAPVIASFNIGTVGLVAANPAQTLLATAWGKNNTPISGDWTDHSQFPYLAKLATNTNYIAFQFINDLNKKLLTPDVLALFNALKPAGGIGAPTDTILVNLLAQTFFVDAKFFIEVAKIGAPAAQEDLIKELLTSLVKNLGDVADTIVDQTAQHSNVLAPGMVATATAALAATAIADAASELLNSVNSINAGLTAAGTDNFDKRLADAITKAGAAAGDLLLMVALHTDEAQKALVELQHPDSASEVVTAITAAKTPTTLKDISNALQLIKQTEEATNTVTKADIGTKTTAEAVAHNLVTQNANDILTKQAEIKVTVDAFAAIIANESMTPSSPPMSNDISDPVLYDALYTRYATELSTEISRLMTSGTAPTPTLPTTRVSALVVGSIEDKHGAKLATLKTLNGELDTLITNRTAAMASGATITGELKLLGVQDTNETNKINALDHAITAVDGLAGKVDDVQAVSALTQITNPEILALSLVLSNPAYTTSLKALQAQPQSEIAIKGMLGEITLSGVTASVAAVTFQTNMANNKMTADTASKDAIIAADVALAVIECLKALTSVAVYNDTKNIIQAFVDATKAALAETVAILVAMVPAHSIFARAVTTYTAVETNSSGDGLKHASAVAAELISVAAASADVATWTTTFTERPEAIAAGVIPVFIDRLAKLSLNPSSNTTGLKNTVVAALITTPLIGTPTGDLTGPIAAVRNILDNSSGGGGYPDDVVKSLVDDFGAPMEAQKKYTNEINNIAYDTSKDIVTKFIAYANFIKKKVDLTSAVTAIKALDEYKRPFNDTLKAPGPQTINMNPKGAPLPPIWGPLLWVTVFNSIVNTLNDASVFAGLVTDFDAFLSKSAAYGNFPKLGRDVVIRWCVLALVLSHTDYDYTIDSTARAAGGTKKRDNLADRINSMLIAFIAGTGSSRQIRFIHDQFKDFPAATIARDFNGFNGLSPVVDKTGNVVYYDFPKVAPTNFSKTLQAIAPMPDPEEPIVFSLSLDLSAALTPLSKVTFCHDGYVNYLETDKAPYLSSIVPDLGAKTPISNAKIKLGARIIVLEKYWVDQKLDWKTIVAFCQGYGKSMAAMLIQSVSIDFGAIGAYGLSLSLEKVAGVTGGMLDGYAEYNDALVHFADTFVNTDVSALVLTTGYSSALELYKAFLAVCAACNDYNTYAGNPAALVHFKNHLAHRQLAFDLMLVELATFTSASKEALDLYAAGIATNAQFTRFNVAFKAPAYVKITAPSITIIGYTSKQSSEVNARYTAFVKALIDVGKTVMSISLELPAVRKQLDVIAQATNDLDANGYQLDPNLNLAQDTNQHIMKNIVPVVNDLVQNIYPSDLDIATLLAKRGEFLVKPLFDCEVLLKTLKEKADRLIPSNIQLTLPGIKFDGDGIDAAVHQDMSAKASYPNDIIRGLGDPCSEFYRNMYGRRTNGALKRYKNYRDRQRLEIAIADPMATKVFALSWKISSLSFMLARSEVPDPMGTAMEIDKAIKEFLLKAVLLRDHVADATIYPANILTDTERSEFHDRIDDATNALRNFPPLSVGSFTVPVNLFNNGPRTLLTESQKLINYETPPTAAFTMVHKTSDIPEDSHSDYLVVAKSPEELQAMKFGKGGRQLFGLVVDAIKPGDDVTALYKAAAIVMKLHPPPEVKATSANRTKGARGWLYRIVRYTDSGVHHLEQITYINSSMYAVST